MEAFAVVASLLILTSVFTMLGFWAFGKWTDSVYGPEDEGDDYNGKS